MLGPGHRSVTRSSDQGLGEAVGSGLGQAMPQLGHRAELSGEPDLAHHQQIGRQGMLLQRARHGDGDREVGRGIGDPNAAGDLEVDVVAEHRELAAALEDGGELGHAFGIHAGDHARGRAVLAAHHQ